ncbi:hypothetical protein RHMOL_Rhmol09G0097900 [Rhododendron molle]|uniref:Uncharacterized protein n=1 Tax=Rhododendron molle TaxID=49168 RepID=A0ACC0MCR4_RHOML|nr:hypothetical protein RHMOL_Rhmol09G0097900 [Rhododendron molle]
MDMPCCTTKPSVFRHSIGDQDIFRGDHGDEAPFDGVRRVLVHPFAPPEGRFHVDGDEEGAVDGGNLTATSYLMETVMMHEIGHVLWHWLAHPSDAAVVMYPSVVARKRKVELGNDDIEVGVAVLEGKRREKR